jgi:anti-anti-sigma factor
VTGKPEVVVEIIGPFEAATVQRWGRRIADAVASRPVRLIIDLRRTQRVDAAAITVLLQTHRATMHTGGRLVLRGPAEPVRRILRLARVDQVFDIEAGERAGAVPA